ncbi:ribosomal RNA small subunit methyltransferase A [candidate division WWE3 bacterium]|uniref:Ribosomal RNA small subunit methyltransferase A n=1 Tax=candidate division WWE3 bacterium TaxID=2053526 RepID=A0A955LI38_UNCKA|nr:ribosomal RNA small subunit methyltransferase A [candidate division WWE3 bacterium]
MLNSTSKNIKTILARYHVSPKQSLGQHFLVNESVIKELVQTPNIQEEDLVLEIGTGFGAVTVPLAHQSKHVFTVEIEPHFLESFRREYPQFLDRVTLIPHNVLTLNIAEFFGKTSFDAVRYHVVGAVPYNITSPIIHKFLTDHPQPDTITLLIQKEVAEKVATHPPHGTYLSNFVSLMGTATIAKNNISPGAFFPTPRVQSAILTIDIHPKYPEIDPNVFSEYLHQGFKHPRKMLRQVLDESTLVGNDINPEARPQELSLSEWVKLFKHDVGIST